MKPGENEDFYKIEPLKNFSFANKILLPSQFALSVNQRFGTNFKAEQTKLFEVFEPDSKAFLGYAFGFYYFKDLIFALIDTSVISLQTRSKKLLKETTTFRRPSVGNTVEICFLQNGFISIDNIVAAETQADENLICQ